jgi:predicted component of viral defense system (DUF524 family)
MILTKAVKIGNYIISTLADSESKSLFHTNSYFSHLIASNSDNSFLYDMEKHIIVLEEWKIYFIQSCDFSITEEMLARRGEYINASISKIQFTNSIGKSYLGEFSIEVKSKKLTTLEFALMLDYVESQATNLAIANMQSSSGFKVTRQSVSFNLNPYFKLKYLIEYYNKDLRPWLKIVCQNPHRVYEDFRYYEDVELMNDFDELSLIEIFSDFTNYIKTSVDSDLSNLFVFNGIKQLPSQINQSSIKDTYNSPENQFVKYLIDSLLNLALKNIGKYDYLSGAMIRNNNLTQIIKDLYSFSRTPFLRNCSKLKSIPFSSQILFKDIKYRKTLEFYKKINAIPSLNFSDIEFEEILELKNIDRLYEYYCFFKLNEIVLSLSNDFSVSKNIVLKDTGMQKSLSISNISYSNDSFYISVYFKKKYAIGTSYSVDLEPDFSIKIENVITRKKVSIFFDSKFKFKDGFVNSEDIHKMHTYKDAIDGFSSFVLYPGNSDIFYSDPKKASNLTGVGAFVMKPNMSTYSIFDYLNNVIQQL